MPSETGVLLVHPYMLREVKHAAGTLNPAKPFPFAVIWTEGDRWDYTFAGTVDDAKAKARNLIKEGCPAIYIPRAEWESAKPRTTREIVAEHLDNRALANRLRHLSIFSPTIRVAYLEEAANRLERET